MIELRKFVEYKYDVMYKTLNLPDWVQMPELAESGMKNIVCAQCFGYLTNRTCCKGMVKPIKERNSDVNIVAIDYDAGASRVNQENRLKLMLANAVKT